ncbi:ATP-binding protein [Marinoscillum sp.]|uniref:ATP-binding protein n=1 Tax=Marinoscillum sp. TaxID=2024838 RepID=UPI003BA95138
MKVLKLTVLLLGILVSHYTWSQNQIKADSIKDVIDKGILSPSQELEAYYWLSSFTSDAYDKLKYGEHLLELAEEAQSLEYQIKANCKIGIAHRFMGNLSRALEYLFKAADQAAGKEQFRNILAEDIYGEISTCYTQNGDFENALYYGSKSINILRQTNRRQYLALTLLNAGYDYYLVGNYDSAMAYYNEAEPILERVGFEQGSAYVIGNRALIYWKQGDREKAKEDLFKALSMLEPIGDDYGMADYYNQLGNIYLEEKAENEAFDYTLKGLQLAKNAGLKEQARDASYLLYKLSLKRGNLQDAIDYQTQYYAYKDSIQNLETTQRLGDMRTEYEVGLKQKEVDLLLEKQRNTQTLLITGGVLLVAFVLLIIVVFSSFRSKQKLTIQLEKQNVDLAGLNQTKDKFFSIISHDLRGPVNTLGGLINVCQMYLKDGNPKQIVDMVDRMEDSIHHMTRLLDTLLNWALQQRGHFPYVPEKLDLNTVITGVIEMFQDNAAAKNIKLQYEADEPRYLLADKNTVSTIFRNLVNNAIKFTDLAGSVKISAQPDTKKKLWIIKVTDDGVGMPADKLGKLFKLNEKISTAGTVGEPGLGLGLQLVYEFTLLNNGSVEVESKPNEGTTFTIKLPMYTSES